MFHRGKPYMVAYRKYDVDKQMDMVFAYVVQKFGEDGEWHTISYNSIGPGDIIRIIDPDTMNPLTPKKIKLENAPELSDAGDRVLYIVYGEEVD